MYHSDYTDSHTVVTFEIMFFLLLFFLLMHSQVMAQLTQHVYLACVDVYSISNIICSYSLNPITSPQLSMRRRIHDCHAPSLGNVRMPGGDSKIHELTEIFGTVNPATLCLYAG